MELQLVCVGQRATALYRLSIQQKAVSFIMQSEHPERGSRKIKILYLEAKVQLKPATDVAWLPRFLRPSYRLYRRCYLLAVWPVYPWSDWRAQNRDNTLLLNKLLEVWNFGGAICLDLADRLKNAGLKWLVQVTKLVFRFFGHVLHFMVN